MSTDPPRSKECAGQVWDVWVDIIASWRHTVHIPAVPPEQREGQSNDSYTRHLWVWRTRNPRPRSLQWVGNDGWIRVTLKRWVPAAFETRKGKKKKGPLLHPGRWDCDGLPSPCGGVLDQEGVRWRSVPG